jgi:hypothetical protein
MKRFFIVFCGLVLFALGAWLLLSVAQSLIASAGQALPWFFFGIGAFGVLLTIAGIYIFKKRWLLVLWPLTAALIFSLVRWVANWTYVFPFASSEITSKPQPTLLLEVWQSQQFLLSLVIGVSWCVTIYELYQSRKALQNK